MNWPKETRSQKELFNFYGKVGGDQTSAIICFPLRLAWDKNKTLNKFTCHEKCKDGFEAIFESIWNYYNKDLEAIRKDNMDLFGGCLNVRQMRGANRWSVHSWGCAIDLDPDRNQLSWGRKKAKMPKHIIEIFQKHGCESLGAARDFDYMHFQFCNRSY